MATNSIGETAWFPDGPLPLALELPAHRWIEDQALNQDRKNPSIECGHGWGHKARRAGGHRWIGFVIDWRTIGCLGRGKFVDQRVWDVAAWRWSAIVLLRERFVARGGELAEVPDFTRGIDERTLSLRIVSG